ASAPNRWVLHADMDAFYASIEQRDHPELRGKPVIVGATSARGVVAAASYEARKYGVRSAMPGFEARRRCPDGVFLPSNIEHYAAVSAEVHAVFERFTPEIEPLALDEAFLDVTGSVGLFGGPRELAVALKRAVLEATELTVSVGVAPNKLVAKIACTLGKPDGLVVTPPSGVRELVDALPIRRLFGVGPVLGRRLESLGIATFRGLAEYDEAALVRAIGDRAPGLQALARGEDDRPVEAGREPKSYGEENTFETDVSDRDVVTGALTAHAEAVARRLRNDGFRGRTVTVKMKLGRARGTRIARFTGDTSEPLYPLVSRSKTLPQPTDDGAVIRRTAVALWDDARIGEPVRLLGVSLSNLSSGRDEQQLELFAPKKDDRLGPALDAITERFGKNAISRAVDAPKKVTPTRARKRGES
ncbi:MAG TPA: DNA polymerase IV, partial [Polyangiaceae bacterium]